MPCKDRSRGLRTRSLRSLWWPARTLPLERHWRAPDEKGKTPWRATCELGPTVDPSGRRELSDILAADPDKLARAFVSHLSRYATGTEVTFADRAEIARNVESTKAHGYGLRSPVHALEESSMFKPR